MKFIQVVKKIINRYNYKNNIFNYKNLQIFSSDIFLVSYPKSGNTWLRFLIGNYISGNQCDFNNINLIIPDIHRNPEQCLCIQYPRFIKSHFPFSHHLMTHKYQKVIYLVRDGRDVAVSYYHHLTRNGKIAGEASFQDYNLIFHQGVIDNFSNWSNHVNFWLDYSQAEILLIKYEDMKSQPDVVLEKVLKFSGIKIDPEKIKKSIYASDFKNMRKKDKDRKSLLGHTIDPSMPFVREGVSGVWRNMFTDELHDLFLHIHGSALKRMSYI